jgi:hypothetical protein
MPSNATFDPLAPEVERKDGGWVVVHYTGSAWLPCHATTEDEARRQAKVTAESIRGSNEFVLVLHVSEAYLPK